jgi:hypothetical protein
LRNILHRQYGLIEFPSIGRILGLGRLFNGLELYECIIAFHINAQQFSKGRKQHLQMFTTRRVFLKVHDKQCIGRCNPTTPVVFFAFDATVAASEFDAECA